jgi:polyisoprenoid-binding protein YceI
LNIEEDTMTATTTTTTTVPGLVPGTWVLDPVHSDVSFSVRHLMVSKVRGRFSRVEGAIHVAGDPFASSVEASIDLTSIDTNNADRDAHIRSADFFDVERYPTMTYTSTGVRRAGDAFVVEGDLSLHGVTRPVALTLEANGVQDSPFGDTRAGFSATAQISRRDFGIDFDAPLDGGGVVVGDKIQIALEIEAVLAR